MRRYLLTLALVLLAVPAAAGIMPCDAAAVTAGYCANETQVILFYPLDPAWLDKLVDDVAEQFGYPTIKCSAADVNAGRCTAGQLGQTAVTTETKQAFSNRMFGVLLSRRVWEREKRLAAEAAAAAVTPPVAIE